MLLNYSKPSAQTERGGVYLLHDTAVTIDQTVNFVVKHTRIFPGTVQETAAAVPYLTVKENFDLFVSKAHPKHRKADLFVDDALAPLELPADVLNQTFASLPLSLSLKLQWVLNDLCNKKVFIIGRWFWSLAASERDDWEELFQRAAKDNQLVVILSGADKDGTWTTYPQLTQLEELLSVIETY